MNRRIFFFFSSRRRHTRFDCDWSSDVCSSDLVARRELTDVGALIGALRDCLVEILAPCAQPLGLAAAHRPFVILVVGVNGSGKTTTIGKLARRCAAEGLSGLLAAAATFRAAAIEQLQVWAPRSVAEFAAQLPGADPGA